MNYRFQNNFVNNQDFDGENITKRFLSFLIKFSYNDPKTNEIIYPYSKEAELMFTNKRSTMYINFADIVDFSNDYFFAETILLDFYKYEDNLQKAVFEFLNEKNPEYSKDKKFFVSFYNLHEILEIRDLKSIKIGKLISISGVITKTTEIKPELINARFICSMCKNLSYEVKQQFKFTEPKKCLNKGCTNFTKWELQPKKSLFMDWQKLVVQENSNSIPPGSMPRSIEVIIRGEQVEKCQPGDTSILTGTLIVVPDSVSLIKPGEKYQVGQNSNNMKRKGFGKEGVSGLKSLGIKDMSYKLVFLCNNIKISNNRWNKIENDEIDSLPQDENDEENNYKNRKIQIEKYYNKLNDYEKQEIFELKNNPFIFHDLAECICPTVFGNIEVKKGILLLLLGGITKITGEKTKLRGDINICIVGDPSTAKSQFLKYVHNFLPRSVYTSGKATSAAGLTASVQKDVDTGEYVIEAGALLLADNGVCCIDEFDKMNDQDQVAIHEAMEQQTISITKAGIQATLNARASILAAANPLLGRYDKKNSLRFNVNLSDPIISRFDLLYILCDNTDREQDKNIANHIIKIHSNYNNSNVEVQTKYSIDKIKRYIKFARCFMPKITHDAAQALKDFYIKMRIENSELIKGNYKVTVRQLESLIRLSEAIAKLHLSNEITVEYVNEAARLLRNSMVKIHRPDIEINFKNTNLYNPDLEKLRKSNSNGKKKQKQKITLKHEEYKLYSNFIIDYLINNDPDKLGVSEENIVENFYLEFKDTINSTQEFLKIEKIIYNIITILIKKERKIIILEGNQEGKRTIQIHDFIN